MKHTSLISLFMILMAGWATLPTSFAAGEVLKTRGLAVTLSNDGKVVGVELGEKKIRVHAISPGPLKTRASSGLKDFDRLLAEAAERAPLGELVDIMDVGFACAYLATPYARRITGGTIYVDGGANIRA